MSRCFPYPPPGYTLSRASQEALIESIKLQKEKEKSEEHRQKKRDKKDKEKKKDKDERRKERKEKKEKRKEKKEKKSDKHTVQKSLPDTKGEFFQKGCEHEPEQLEKSSVTEEHGKPVCLREPSSSSDSTENSNKRKRESYPIDSNRNSHGNIIRIRLSSKKQKQNLPDTSANECSTSGRIPVPSINKDDIAHRQRSGHFCSTSEGTGNKAQTLSFSINREKTSQKIGTVPAAAKASPSPPVAVIPSLTPIQKEALQYNNLIQNWTPPQLWDVSLGGDDDCDWLYKGRSQERRVAEKRSLPVNESVSCSSSSTLWPSAQYLREADVFALPYTVPF